MMGQPAQAFENQNHEAHLQTHASLFLTNVVKENPQIQTMIISHCMQHLQFLSSQVAQTQIPEEVQVRIQEVQAQMQTVSPQEAMVIQQEIQMILDQFSSPIMAELTNEFLQSIGMGGSEDPLVDIRKQELDLRDKELDMDQDQFIAKQEQRAQEKLLDANLQERRLDVQKTIANDKLKVAIDRLKQNADLKLIELEQKFKGNK
jgi:hypothetical protein